MKIDLSERDVLYYYFLFVTIQRIFEIKKWLSFPRFFSGLPAGRQGIQDYVITHFWILD
jgi:hypothetical protein